MIDILYTYDFVLKKQEDVTVNKRTLSNLGILLLILAFILQVLPIVSFADEQYNDPDAETVYVSGGQTELDEQKTEGEGSGGAGYYDNGTYTNRDLLEAGDYYVQKQFDWTDKESGKGNITFKTKLNVTSEPTRAVYAFTPCEAHGFLRRYAKENVEFLLGHYDTVDLVWITTQFSTPYSEMPESWGVSDISGSGQYFDYSNIHYYLDVGGDSDDNGRQDYMDIIYPQAPSDDGFDWRTIGTTNAHWKKSANGNDGCHQGINLYTGLYAYLTNKETTDPLFTENQSHVLQDSEIVNRPSFIYLSLDGLLDTRCLPHSGMPFVRNTQYNYRASASNNPAYTDNCMWSYPLINYDCWSILRSYDESNRYFSLGTSGNGGVAYGKSVSFALQIYTATNEDRLNTANRYPESFHWELWNELLALINPMYMKDNDGDGSYTAADIQAQADTGRLWNGHRRITNSYWQEHREEEPGYCSGNNLSSGQYRYIRNGNGSFAYEFDSDYDADFATLNVPTAGMKLVDNLSDSFDVDSSQANAVEIKAIYNGTELAKTTATEGLEFSYGEGTQPLSVKYTVNEENGKLTFNFSNYKKDTEIEIVIHVKVDEQNATDLNKWTNTNKDTDGSTGASLEVNLDDGTDISYPVTSPKAHIEGYHIDTEVIGGTIDPDRDVREGGSCEISYAPRNSNFVLDRITLTKYNEDGTVAEETTFDTEEALQSYLKSYPFSNVQNDWKIEVVFVELQEITITKKWDDNGDAAGLRPAEAAGLITLTADPAGTTDDPNEFVPGDPAVTKDGDTWTYKWTKLRKYSDEQGKNAITYTFAENTTGISKAYEAPVYEPADQKVADGTGEVTNELKLISIAVDKTWSDGDNVDGIRPETLNIKLFADGVEVPNKSYTLKESENWTCTFTDLPLKNDRGEEAQYRVVEDSAADSGYTRESDDVDFDIEEDTMTIGMVNKHITYARVKVGGTKKLTGRDMSQGEFKFKVEAGDVTTQEAVTDGTVVLPDDNALADAASDGAEGAFEFEEIVLKKAGTYKFNISEVVPSEDGDGITYDRSKKEVTLTVEKVGDALKVTPEPDLSGVKFSNSYSAKGFYTPSGQKTLTGQSETESDEEPEIEPAKKSLQAKQPKGEEVDMAMKDGQFKFEVRYTNGDEFKDQKASEGSNKAAAAGETAEIDFDDLEYTTEFLKQLVEDRAATKDEDGTYHISYYVVETEPDAEYYQHNTGLDSFSVAITDDGKGNLSVATDPKDATVSFANRYITDTAVISLDGLKVFTTDNGTRTLKAGDFTFVVECLDGAPQPSDVQAENDEGGAVSFGEIEFTKGDIGDTDSKDFVYEITEIAGDAHGMTYDEKTRTVTVTVTDDGEGKLTATTDPETTPLFTFNNTYEPDPVSETVNSDIAISKKLKNGDLKADQFKFTIEPADDETKASVNDNIIVMPENTTVSNKANGTITFGDITYNKAGTYMFRISEVIPAGAEKQDGKYVKDKIIYDDSEYTVEVVVADDEEGKLYIESQKLSDGSKKAEFTNEIIEEHIDPTRFDDDDDDDNDGGGGGDDDDDDSDNVRTGDSSDLMRWIVLLIAAVAGIAAVYMRRRSED